MPVEYTQLRFGMAGRKYGSFARFDASEITGASPSLQWIVGASSLSAGSAEITGNAATVQWLIGTTTLVAGAVEITGTSPSLQWLVGSGTLDIEGQLSGTSPSLQWVVGNSLLRPPGTGQMDNRELFLSGGLFMAR